MTSRTSGDPGAVTVHPADFARGRLNQPGNDRPARLFTAESSLVLYSVGVLRTEVMQRVTDAIVNVLRR